MKRWYLDTLNEIVEQGDVIRRDFDGWHVVGHGYVPDDMVFESEKKAKEALKEFLNKRLVVIQARLKKLEG